MAFNYPYCYLHATTTARSITHASLRLQKITCRGFTSSSSLASLSSSSLSLSSLGSTTARHRLSSCEVGRRGGSSDGRSTSRHLPEVAVQRMYTTTTTTTATAPTIRLASSTTAILRPQSKSFRTYSIIGNYNNNINHSNYKIMGRRYASEMSVHRTKYAAVVVGGGPAGITVVGNLLERNVKPLLWVDEEFKAGRVNRSYREVPSNTKVKLFVDFAEATEPFRAILSSTPSPNAIDTIRDLPQDQGCRLSYAADMCLMLTEGLMKTPGVEARQSRVTSATLDSSNNNNDWIVELSDSSKAISSRLVLCTGSSPNTQNILATASEKSPALKPLDLDIALTPSKLSDSLSKDEKITVAVIGASHSAVLVLINLFNLANSGSHPNLRVKWFTRHPLRYAEFMDGWILRDNTGLKGAAAAWARENLEPEKFAQSPASNFITKIEYSKENEAETYERELVGDCQSYVQAIGYTRDPTPPLSRADDGAEIALNYNHETGGFSDAAGQTVPGLFGAGIAWPERVTDPHGNVEYAVGFWKFMRYIKRVVKDWN